MCRILVALRWVLGYKKRLVGYIGGRGEIIMSKPQDLTGQTFGNFNRRE